MTVATFPSLHDLAQQLRREMEQKKFVLLYAYNGTGKTRLSVAFKDLGKRAVQLEPLLTEAGEPIEAEDGTTLGVEAVQGDTLYFNAFTEDLFHWDNDLQNDRERVLKINRDSLFFAGLGELEMDNRIRPLLNRYADFDFRIDTAEWEVTFSREVEVEGVRTIAEDIKVSRGEENIFIWCFFLAIVQLVLDGAEAYKWVKYVYIDDPISSLDDNNAVTVAHHLAQMLMASAERVKTVISTHHVLFFNVLCNELKKSRKYFLSRNARSGNYLISETDSTPFLYHLASLVELHEAACSGALYTHHFNIMRRVMEQTACFFGYAKWEECIKPEVDDPNKTLYKRVIDLMSHGDYSLYEPREMLPENKEHFGRALRQFISTHPFSPTLFGGAP
ncbi:AAA family ATPase [Pseudomonas qingdaonensis]|uniref:AAA family ATPase n=1 Tax=Pseudomonas qingdaonensis TaxID=2056231 RepID=UPI002E18A1F1|nr:AAA family ATPase [Pseudomonas qingdaonensis]